MTVLLCGTSGCGKSTLSALLVYPCRDLNLWGQKFVALFKLLQFLEVPTANCNAWHGVLVESSFKMF